MVIKQKLELYMCLTCLENRGTKMYVLCFHIFVTKELTLPGQSVITEFICVLAHFCVF